MTALCQCGCGQQAPVVKETQKVGRMTSADLRYDKETHTTTTPDGRDVPHVTRVLAETGVSTDFEQLMAISRRHREHVEDRRILGSVIHEDLHKFDDGDLAWDTVDPRVEPYIRAWETCRRNLNLVPIVRERQIFHPQDAFTGFLDGIFEQAFKVVLIDLKIGNPDHAGAKFQTAAYVAAYLAEHHGQTIHERWAIQLIPENPVPYAVRNYGSNWRADYRKFQSFLTTFREQPARRRSAA